LKAEFYSEKGKERWEMMGKKLKKTFPNKSKTKQSKAFTLHLF